MNREEAELVKDVLDAMLIHRKALKQPSKADVCDILDGMDISVDKLRIALGMDKPVRTLTCSCCAGEARGRQWHNRDTGYGLCDQCAERISRPLTQGDMHLRYGVKGVHYCVEASTNLYLQGVTCS